MLLHNASIGVTREFGEREARAYLRSGWEELDMPDATAAPEPDLRHPVFGAADPPDSASTASDPTEEASHS